jgi:hypothetical protein
MNRKPLFTLAAALGLLAACSATSFTSSWKAPDAGPLQFKPGDKVIALVVAESAALRRAGEANLADQLDARGLTGVPAYTVVVGESRDEATAKRAIDASGAVALVAMRPMGKEQEISSTPTGYYGSPYYGSYWGGYHGYGWGGAWGGYEVRTDTYVFIETLVYDLRQNKLVWAGQSKTMNPSDVEGFVAELAEAVGKELRAVGLIAAK